MDTLWDKPEIRIYSINHNTFKVASKVIDVYWSSLNTLKVVLWWPIRQLVNWVLDCRFRFVWQPRCGRHPWSPAQLGRQAELLQHYLVDMRRARLDARRHLFEDDSCVWQTQDHSDLQHLYHVADSALLFHKQLHSVVHHKNTFGYSRLYHRQCECHYYRWECPSRLLKCYWYRHQHRNCIRHLYHRDFWPTFAWQRWYCSLRVRLYLEVELQLANFASANHDNIWLFFY